MCVFAARVAASLRKSGKPDPLCDIDEVTTQVLDFLGDLRRFSKHLP